MRIDAGSSNLYASQRPQASTAHSASTSFSAALATTKSDSSKPDGIKNLDFTSMTRQEMRDWASTKFSNGELSLDDTRPFMMLTMKVAAGSGVDVPVESDEVRYDFTQNARDAMLSARLQNNEVSAKIFELGLSIMQREQGHAIGVSSRA